MTLPSLYHCQLQHIVFDSTEQVTLISLLLSATNVLLSFGEIVSTNIKEITHSVQSYTCSIKDLINYHKGSLHRCIYMVFFWNLSSNLKSRFEILIEVAQTGRYVAS